LPAGRGDLAQAVWILGCFGLIFGAAYFTVFTKPEDKVYSLNW
jgi:hypothetical protein